jgi:hypothetical protein
MVKLTKNESKYFCFIKKVSTLEWGGGSGEEMMGAI